MELRLSPASHNFIVNSSKSCFFNLSLTRISVTGAAGYVNGATSYVNGNTRHATGNARHVNGNTRHATGNTSHVNGNTSHVTRITGHAAGSTIYKVENCFNGGNCIIKMKSQIKYSKIINNLNN